MMYTQILIMMTDLKKQWDWEELDVLLGAAAIYWYIVYKGNADLGAACIA